MAKPQPPVELSNSYFSWDKNDPASFQKAAAGYSKGLDKIQPMYKSSAAIANRYQNIDGPVSVRDSFSANDYAFFRPGEMQPRYMRDVIAACLGAYEKISTVRQVIDLMGDFTAQGIRLVHPDPEIQNLYTEWFKRVDGEERSERIANCLYKSGNVIIKRADAILDGEVVSEWKKTIAQHEIDMDYDPGDVDLKDNSIPYKYTILNPMIIEVLGEQMAAFTGKVDYVIKMPTTFYNTLSIPITSYDPNILTADLPQDIKRAFDRRDPYLILDSKKLSTIFYKKDDWNVWAYPMMYSLLDEFMMLQKLKQADMCAIDGIISHIRIWKLGSLEHNIFPSDAAIQKLASILLNHTGGGEMDFIWGPDIELQETSTDIGKFLGSEKYEFVINTINNGLGIPAAIGQSKGDMSSNFMSLRILMERLVYGRKLLTHFWEQEIKRIQISMGFKTAPYIQYDNMVLHDEAAEKALWIQLLDRDVIPVEAIQERFGRIPEIDNLLIKKEYAARKKGNVATKVSPYHDSEPKLSLTKIGLQRGAIAPDQLPTEFDLDLKDLSKEETDQHLTMTNPQVMLAPKVPPGGKKPKPKGVSGQGRPKTSTDKNKRKARTPNPTAKGEEDLIKLVLRAGSWQKTIAEVVNSAYLADIGKNNLRKLTAEEGIALEKAKFEVLFNIPYDVEKVDAEVIRNILDQSEMNNTDAAEQLYVTTAEAMRQQKGCDLDRSELDHVKSYVYALLGV